MLTATEQAFPQVSGHAEAALDNIASSCSTRRRGRRRDRHVLRARLRKISRLPRLRQCGYTPVTGDQSGPAVRVTSAGGTVTAGLSGLSTCGSTWSCPVCSARIATTRAGELSAVMRHAFSAGCDAAMITLTVRHHQAQALRDCWDAVIAGWRAVTSGRQWVADQADHRVRGWVRVVEVTRGKHGWHVHVHALVIFDGPVTPGQLRDLQRSMWKRWDAAARRRGFDALPAGSDIRQASLSPGRNGLHVYFTKLAHEMTGGAVKLARGGGETPFQLLSLAAGGEADALAAWWEWEKASRGRRQVGWSQGLREWAALGEEASDEDAAAASLEGDDVLVIDPVAWRVMRHDPHEVCDLLDVAESYGYQRVMRWLRHRGYGYTLINFMRRKT